MTADTLPVDRADSLKPASRNYGDYLVSKGLVSPDAVAAALKEREVTGDNIGSILVRNGFLAHSAMVETILAFDPGQIAHQQVVAPKVPADLLDEHAIVLAAETETVVYLATMKDETTAKRLIAPYYPGKEIQFVGFSPDEIDDFIFRARKRELNALNEISRDNILEGLLHEVLNHGGSDIHIVPRGRSYTVLARFLGVRKIVHEGTMDEYLTVCAQLKDRSRIDIAERRIPQDGSLQIEHNNRMIDVRVATIPAAEGEKIVMRLLDPDRVTPILDKLGITEVGTWRKSFKKQHGLCLICGPTGSGKTTTLNASIREMDRFGRAIYTVEDPVEYRIPFVDQISINPSVDLTFSRAVKHFMRADPDVIVLGEVRDEDTARNAIKASDTGHLVLATLHTGSIMGAITRLRDLGIPPHELKYQLRGVLVQNLIRTLCPDCGGMGCAACFDMGYAGRTVVSECTAFHSIEDVENAMNGETSWTTILEDAIAKMRTGLTDRNELVRVFGSDIERRMGGAW